MSVGIDVDLCVYIYMHIPYALSAYSYTALYMYISMYVYMHVCVYVYVCMYVYILKTRAGSYLAGRLYLYLRVYICL